MMQLRNEGGTLESDLSPSKSTYSLRSRGPISTLRKRRAPNRGRSLDRLRSLLLVLPLLLPLSCGGVRKGPANVILITVDVLRPDHLGFGGAPRATSPNLDRLASEGIVFTRSYSQSGWTLPSIATIMTGRYPMDHQAVDFQSSMNRSLPTLAGLLKEHGYDTRGYVSHVLLTPKYGIDEGFTRYDASVLDRGNPHLLSSSKELTDLAINDIKDLKEPFFIWIHYFDPHFVYLRHEGWTSFGDTDLDRYDQEIAYTDFHIGRLLDFFRAKGLYNRTNIVLTADHGEEFGEHGGSKHETCYEEILRVPLVIEGPGLTHAVTEGWSEQIDLMPTILHLVGLEAPKSCPGRSLLPLSPGSPPDHGPIFVERDRPTGYRQRAIISGVNKLIRIEAADTNPDLEADRSEPVEIKNVRPGTYLYNLQNDRHEEKNLFVEGDSCALQLLARMALHFAGAATGPAETTVVDRELRERLRSLGYIR
jgi:arylsulfatase A-like enzyme